MKVYGYCDNKCKQEVTRKTIEIKEANTDLNDYKEEGKYFFAVNYSPTNRPDSTSNGWLEVIGGASNCIKQIWYKYGTINENDYNTFVRTYMEGSWSIWRRIATTRDLGVQFSTATFTYKGSETNSNSSWDYPEGFTKDHTKVLTVMEWDSATDTWKNNNSVTVRMGADKISLENYNTSSTIQVMVFSTVFIPYH